MIQVAIVDDNLANQEALKEKLVSFNDINIAFTAENGAIALECLETTDIDLVLMDIEMPHMNGIEATRQIRHKFPDIKIVIITIYENDDYIFNAIMAGADSYILKDSKSQRVYETITDTINGGSVMSPSIAVKTLKLIKNVIPAGPGSDYAFDLSEREIEILNHLSLGLTNKKIGEILFISPFTVKRHIENIYKKLQAKSRIELVEKAKRNGLI